MKRLLVAAALLGVAAAPANAAFVLWQGDVFITSVNGTDAQCAAIGFHTGDFARAIFRPKSVAGSTNGATDLLALHFARTSVQLAPTTPAGGSLNGATGATVRIIYGSAGFQQFTGVALSNVVVSPASPPAAATASISVQLTVANFYSSSPSSPSGCTATFKGNLGKRLS